MDNKQNLTELDFTVMPPSEPRRLPDPYPSKSPAARKKWIFLICLVLAAGAVGGYNSFFNNAEPGDSSEILPSFAGHPPLAREGDTDADGLGDRIEEREGTNFQKPDTDGDGLSDGDEFNIYGSDPLLPDTDHDSYDDGREAARGFSPIQNTLDQAGAGEVQKWAEKIKEFGLHEPTKTTLKIQAPLKDLGEPSIYINQRHAYEITLPKILTYREADEQRIVGIYVAGTTTPTDDDLLTDPFSIISAVKVPGQSLRDWIQEQYPEKKYERLEEVTLNSAPAIRLFGVKNEVCDSKKFFWARQETVIIFTLTCSENETFGEYFENIAKSFKFTDN